MNREERREREREREKEKERETSARPLLGTSLQPRHVL